MPPKGANGVKKQVAPAKKQVAAQRATRISAGAEGSEPPKDTLFERAGDEEHYYYYGEGRRM